VLFLDDGRVELDTNSIERAIRPIALGRALPLGQPWPGDRKITPPVDAHVAAARVSALFTDAGGTA
jgi:hypothetical protein